MPLLLPRSVFLCALLLSLTTAAPAQSLSPTAARDLAVLATAYPGAMAAIEVDAASRATVVLVDGTRLPYDDGRRKSPEELLDAPDLEDTLAEPYPLGPVTAEPAPGFSPGRRRVEPLLLALYGRDKAAVTANCRAVPFLGQSMAFNTRYGAADAFVRVEKRLARLLAADRSLSRFLLPASGGVVWRVIAGTDRLSVHAFAAAVDVSPKGNPYWRDLPPGTNMLTRRQGFPVAVVEAFEAEGFIWGGKWSEFDLMHFEYRPELTLLARLARGERLPLAEISGLLRPSR
ncbi:M15 family metallopeptidase [Solidesulfovibrio sp.]